MSMDKPLAGVVQGSWNREVFKVAFKKSQDRAALMSQIMKKMRSGDSDEALKDIANAKLAAADDIEAIADLDRLELSIKLAPIMAKIRSGDVEVGIKLVDELMQAVSPGQRSQLSIFKFRLLMQQDNKDAAAEAINQMANEENADPQRLNDVAWQVHEYAKEAPDDSKSLVAAAVAASEKALESPQDNGYVWDTLAHLVQLQGDLDRAIELQVKALEYPAGATPEMKEYLEQLRKEKAERN